MLCDVKGTRAKLLRGETPGVTKMKKSTLFDVKEDPELLVPNYLVTYRNPEKTFLWSHHNFKVKADDQAGIFTCECMLWELTGKNHKN